jgi:hypothetical protein
MGLSSRQQMGAAMTTRSMDLHLRTAAVLLIELTHNCPGVHGACFLTHPPSYTPSRWRKSTRLDIP